MIVSVIVCYSARTGAIGPGYYCMYRREVEMSESVPVNVFTGLCRHPFPDEPSQVNCIGEDLLFQGFSIIPEVISEELNQEVREEIDRLTELDIRTWGKPELSRINDLGVLRNPFLTSDLVVSSCFSEMTLAICQEIFGTQFVLNVNRAVINDVSNLHPASVWHREPAYQNFSTSRPLSLTFVLAVDRADELTGGIRVLPVSQNWSSVPSDRFFRENALHLTIPERGMLVFDSSVIHSNTQSKTIRRRSLVSIFSSPLLKQQTNIVKMLRSSEDAMNRICHLPNYEFIFGLDTDPFDSDALYREHKIKENLTIC